MFTSQQEVATIADLGDPILRNYRITESYHQLSRLVAQRTGAAANWCTFATWASRQAGQTIRKEDLLQLLEEYVTHDTAYESLLKELGGALMAKGAVIANKGIGKLIWSLLGPEQALERASEAVALGNRKVYAEIGLEFARFIEQCAGDQVFTQETIDNFCAALRPGAPPEGQEYLQRAFGRYYQAFFETEAKRKAELLLAANIEIGFHEQTRLQPEILAALNASIPDAPLVRQQLFGMFFPDPGWLDRTREMLLGWFGIKSPLDETLGALIDHVRQQMRLFMTRHMMELGIPDQVRLHLGADLRASFPNDLQQIDNADLRALLQQIDPTPDSLKDTGALDWSSLPERLHFIADMFRCYQETPALNEPPFDAALSAKIESGLIH